MSLPNDDKLKILSNQEVEYDNFLYLICGLENNRYKHQDKDSYINALNWELNDDGKKLLERINKELFKYNKNHKDILNIFLNCKNNIVVDIGFEIILDDK